MDYKKMSAERLEEVRLFAVATGNLEAAREISDYKRLFGKRVVVSRGRKVPVGTVGTVVWLKRFVYGGSSQPGTTRIGIRDDSGATVFTDAMNVDLLN